MLGVGKRTISIVVVLLLSLIAASPTLAILVRPIIIDLVSSGGGANGQIEVVNDRNTAVAVEIKVKTLTLPERGDPVIGADADGDFMVFPSIAQLKPGGKQVFRVRYIGNAALPASKLYMFATSELPVSETPGDERARIEVLYSISSVVAVRAAGAKAAINVVGVERSTNDAKLPGLRILFENSGAAHGYVGDAALDLSSAGWRKTIDARDTSKAFGLGLIPAGARRSLFIPIGDLPSTGAVAVDLKPASK